MEKEYKVKYTTTYELEFTIETEDDLYIISQAGEIVWMLLD